jgi:ATP-dependent protease ClpP protease subunit
MREYISSFVTKAGLAALFTAAATATALSDEMPDATPIQNEVVELSGYLDETAFNKAAQALYNLRAENPDARIRIEIGDTRGGQLESGFAFANTLNQLAPVDLVCNGNLQSMAANLFVSWQGGERIAGENCSNLMLHDVIYTVPTKSIGQASFVREYVTEIMDNLAIPYAMMTQATANASGLSLESAQALYGFDCHLTPEQAYSLNLVDRLETFHSYTIERLQNQTPEDIHALCQTQPMKGFFEHTDWSQFNYNGVTAADIQEP